MQFERGPGAGKDFPILGPLPHQNIDTGLGVERMATLLQGVDNVYEIDLLRPILDRAGEITGTRYGAEQGADVRIRVVADHARTATMLIGDGVTPGNEGRGYVLRRMLRRAVRSMRLLGAGEPVMRDLVAATIGAMGPSYPELVTDRGRIDTVAVVEEESFLATLRTGTTLFDTAVAQTRRAGGTVLAGEQAFALHDTYGFPIDLTLEMAAEAGLSVDSDGFRRLMAEQRRRAKADSMARKTGHTDLSAYRGVLDSAGPSTFTGYVQVATEATVRGLLRAGESVAALAAGEEAEVVLRSSWTAPVLRRSRRPAGRRGPGQLVDGAELEVFDVQRPLPDLVVHRARVARGEVVVGAGAQALVDVERRRAISRAHTATHLIHRAVRGLVGESATQAGSENAPGRLRFDFASPTAVDPKLLADVEDEVNDVLIDDLEVRAFITSQDEARRIGAMALFGEKYGDEVRVVEVGDYARELCGGTHAQRSGQLGLVKLLGEASIGAGCTPGRGAGRAGRLPLPGPRARAGRPAHRGAQGAGPRSCPSASTPCCSGSRTPSARSTAYAPARSWPRRPRSPPAGPRSTGSVWWPSCCPRVYALATRARSRSTCAAGPRWPDPRSWSWVLLATTASSRSSSRPTRRPQREAPARAESWPCSRVRSAARVAGATTWPRARVRATPTTSRGRSPRYARC